MAALSATRRPHGAKRTPVAEGGLSLRQRFAELEANVMGNLHTMHRHREAMEQIEQMKKQRFEAMAAEMTQDATRRETNSMTPNMFYVPCQRTLKDRCRAVEEQADTNHQVLASFRLALDDAQAKRRQEESDKAAVVAMEVSAAAAAKAEEERCAAEAKARILQATPTPTSLGDGALAVNRMRQRDARTAYAERRGIQRPLSAMSSRSAPASAVGCRHGAVGCGTPTSGWTAGGRPNSAPLGGDTTRRMLGGNSRPPSAVTSRPNSRPSSAYTLTARIRSLRDEAQRNQETMNQHRQVIDSTIKFQKEREEAMRALSSALSSPTPAQDSSLA